MKQVVYISIGGGKTYKEKNSVKRFAYFTDSLWNVVELSIFLTWGYDRNTLF